MIYINVCLCILMFLCGCGLLKQCIFYFLRVQVRVTGSKEAPVQIKTENGAAEDEHTTKEALKTPTPATPKVANGCTPPENENSVVNGTGNGVTEGEETSPSSGKGKEDAAGKKKLLPLLYDVSVIGEDRNILDVPAKDLQ